MPRSSAQWVQLAEFFACSLSADALSQALAIAMVMASIVIRKLSETLRAKRGRKPDTHLLPTLLSPSVILPPNGIDDRLSAYRATKITPVS
ncbi:hypothetical protein PPGU16_26160 [Paraburkholderia largidicola]|uniref:Uncharacterized protein n=1 Tax=Paraburkholderia largidicola TaxID=3014751 RepID=A0A7I8BMQ0_9BURK|nr:hypothetical protein PPGU16_26160 [Paraburkholderia sp. PGU16]